MYHEFHVAEESRKGQGSGKSRTTVLLCMIVSRVRAGCAPVSWLIPRQQGLDVVGKECLSLLLETRPEHDTPSQDVSRHA